MAVSNWAARETTQFVGRGGTAHATGAIPAQSKTDSSITQGPCISTRMPINALDGMDDDPASQNQDRRVDISTCHELANRGARTDRVHRANVAFDLGAQMGR